MTSPFFIVKNHPSPSAKSSNWDPSPFVVQNRGLRNWTIFPTKWRSWVMTIKFGEFWAHFQTPKDLANGPTNHQVTIKTCSKPSCAPCSIVGITTNARRPRQTRKKSSRNQPQPGFVKRRSAPWVIIWGIFLEYQQWTVSVKLGLDHQRSWVFANKHQILWVQNRT